VTPNDTGNSSPLTHSPGVEIRQATLADVGMLMEVLKACISSMRARGIDQWDSVYPDRSTIECDVRSGTAVVATIDRDIVGMAVLSDYQYPEYGQVSWLYSGRAAVMYRLMVAPALEGRGIARVLVEVLETRAAQIGYECIRLDAFHENDRAVKFYERADYRRAGQVRFRKGLFDCFEKQLCVPANYELQRPARKAG